MFRFVFLFLFLSHFLFASDSLFVKVHFVYGSKPKSAFKKIEAKQFGGIHGGHVYLNLKIKLLAMELIMVNGIYFLIKVKVQENIELIKI
jgi:hypothetical protein